MYSNNYRMKSEQQVKDPACVKGGCWEGRHFQLEKASLKCTTTTFSPMVLFSFTSLLCSFLYPSFHNRFLFFFPSLLSSLLFPPPCSTPGSIFSLCVFFCLRAVSLCISSLSLFASCPISLFISLTVSTGTGQPMG